MKCTYCSKELTTRSQIKYCSNKCQLDFQYDRYIQLWKSGKKNGNRGILTRNISCYIARYLMEKYGERCYMCGWDKRNKITGKVPVEVDHIDGNSENSQEKNLRLICPNCHSLTANFRNLNKGKGRLWRKNKYLKN